GTEGRDEQGGLGVAPVVRCRDGEPRPPLSEVGEWAPFGCRGCGRALKVPETVPRAAAPQPQPAAPAPAPASAPANPTAAGTPVEVREPTRVMPLVTQNAAPPDQAAPKPAPATGRANEPWCMQPLPWI